MSQAKQWIYNLKRLPNAKHRIASGVCSSGAIVLVLIVYLIAEAMGYKLKTYWVIGFIAIAEMIATIVFFTWAKAASKLKEKEKQHGS